MVKPIKNLGQNFLEDIESVNKMVDGLNISEQDMIMEIGPGLGAVTDQILEKGKGINFSLLAVEIDPRVIFVLEEKFAGKSNVQITEANILDFLPTYETKNYKIIGSLPYYITSPIIHAIIKKDNKAKKVVILVQKEVAEKISNKAPRSSYLSTFIQTFYETKYLGEVSRDKFNPAPKVDSGILELTLRKDVTMDQKRTRKYEGFLHKSFSNPRKMLNKVFTKEELEKTGMESGKRPQNYSWEEWLKAFEILTENND